MLYKNAIQYQQTRTIQVDLGSGINVGVNFSSSNPSLLSVSALGKVEALQDPDANTSVWVYVRDAQNFLRNVVEFEVVPTSTSLSGLLDPVTGQPTSGIASVAISDASETPAISSYTLREGVAGTITVSGLIPGISYSVGSLLGGSLVSVATATANGSGQAVFSVTPDIGDSSLLLGVYRALTQEEILSPVSLTVLTSPLVSIEATDFGDGTINVQWVLTPDVALPVTLTVLRSSAVVTSLTDQLGTPAASGSGFTASVDLTSVASGTLVVRVSYNGFNRDSQNFSFTNPNIVGAGWGLTAWGIGPWGQ